MMEATIEEILDRVQVVNPESVRERSVTAILAELSSVQTKRRRRRWFGFLLSVGIGGVVAVSPVGQAVAEFFTGGGEPELSVQDRALTRVACEELGPAAAQTSWCTDVEDDAGASAEQLLKGRGYKITRIGPAMAIESPDGTVLVTGLDELDPEDVPDEIGGVKINSDPPPRERP